MKEIIETLKYFERKKSFNFSLKEINFLLTLNKRIFNKIDKKLNEEFEYGFNLHGKDHIKRVFLIAKNLINVLKLKNINFKTLAISLLYHDLGNLIERKKHYFYSREILKNFLKNFSSLEQEKILISVYSHEINGLKELFQIKLLDDFYKNGKLISTSFINFYRSFKRKLKFLPTEAKILFVADNLDLGPHRLPIKKFRQKDFWLTEKDVHVFINTLWRFEKIEKINGKVCLKFIFNPYLEKKKIKNKEIYNLVTKGKRVYFPQKFYEIYKFHHISFFDISLGILFNLYQELIYLFLFLSDLSKEDFVLNLKDETNIVEKNIYLSQLNFPQSIYKGIILPFRLHKK